MTYKEVLQRACDESRARGKKAPKGPWHAAWLAADRAYEVYQARAGVRQGDFLSAPDGWVVPASVLPSA